MWLYVCGELYVCPQKNLIAFILNKVLLNQQKTRHYWTPQLIRSTKALFGVRRVNKTKVTGAYYNAVEMKHFIVISLLKQT